MVNDDYVRAKVAEAYADPAGSEPADMDKVKAEFHRRMAAKDDAQR